MILNGASIVYLLCLATSVVCAILLMRSYFRTRTRLLLWAAICFVFLAFNNLFVVIDMVVMPDVDFRPFRHATALAGIGVLLFGFVWESR